MLRKALITQLVFLLLLPVAPAQTALPTVKEQVLELKPDTLVNVKMKEKGKPKLRGRIHSISDQGFALKTVRADKVEDLTLSFTDVKSIKAAEGHHTGRNIGIGILAGIGICALLLTILATQLD